MNRPAMRAGMALALIAATTLGACRAAQPDASAGPTPSSTAATPTALPSGPAPTSSIGSSPSANPTPDASASGTPSLSPSGSPAPSVDAHVGVAWQLADTSAFSSGDVLSDAAALGPVVVAVGTSEDELAGATAAAWYSLDGYSWQRADALPEAEAAALESVAAGPAGLVAVGFDASGDAPRPAAWVSTDGRSWIRSADPDLGRGQMAAVAGGADGYVALGSDLIDGRSLFWTSGDGVEWSPATQVPGVDVEATINGLATIGQGFIAYGTSASETAQMWFSVDGRRWQAVADFPSEASSTVSDVALGEDRFVAVGARYLGDTARALVWTSADGLSWQREAVELDGEMIGVEPVAAGFYAVGAVPEANELVFAAGVWASADGAAWQRRPDDPSFELARMIELLHAGPGLVVIGEKSVDAAGEELAPAVWVGTPQ